MFLDELREGSTGTVVVMICRRWDVTSINSRYMSTDYVVSDKKGNFMHCVAKSHVAHLFVEKLKEGGLFSFRGFDVVLRKKYMLWEDMPYVIELHGSTVIRKVSGDVSGFTRYPFKLTAFEDLKPTENNFFTDVIGYVTSVGEQSIKSNGARTVEFNLCNERKRGVRVTLWGDLGDLMIKKKREYPAVYFLILTSMSAKYYLNNLCLSSSSSTLLIDSDDIPDLQAFKSSVGCVHLGEYNEPITEDTPVVTTLRDLVDRSRESKSKEHTVIFQNIVKITNIRTRTGWFLYTCTGSKCRKGLERVAGSFKCKSCQSKVDYPRTRYRIQVEIDDGTMSTIVVLFDEIAQKLLGRTAKSLVDEQLEDTSAESSVLPPLIEALIGTRHELEIRSHTYYHYGEYESFNCAKHIKPVVDGDTVTVADEVDAVKSKTDQASSSVVFKTDPPVSTPASETERKLRRNRVEDSESDGLADDGLDGGTTNVKHPAKKRLFKGSGLTDDDAYSRDMDEIEDSE